MKLVTTVRVLGCSSSRLLSRRGEVSAHFRQAAGAIAQWLLRSEWPDSGRLHGGRLSAHNSGIRARRAEEVPGTGEVRREGLQPGEAEEVHRDAAKS